MDRMFLVLSRDAAEKKAAKFQSIECLQESERRLVLEDLEIFDTHVLLTRMASMKSKFA